MLAIRTSRLFDGERFVAGEATVLVDGGAIAGVEDGFPDLPAGTDVRRVENGTLLPGLIDTHVHLVGDSAFGALDRVAEYTDEQLEDVMIEALRKGLLRKGSDADIPLVDGDLQAGIGALADVFAVLKGGREVVGVLR